MAFTQGVKMKECHAEIIQKLNSNGECLQNSTLMLLLEMKVLNKLIYKSRNTHSKEKFFKCLERIKKCLNKWKLLDLDSKVITASRKISDTEFCNEILNKIMLGGKLSLRVIILCQETVQYNLAYLSRGFFVPLHVTFLSLLSRLWVLQQDCLKCVVECYQFVRSLIQLHENHIDLNEFPESLTSWLGEDVQKIFDGKSTDDALSVVNSSNPIFQRLFCDKKADADTSTMFSDDVSNNELDLGEPVDDMRIFHSPGCPTPAIIHDKTVSDLKTNLTLKFDLESSGRKNFPEIDLIHADSVSFRRNENTRIVKRNGERKKLSKDGTLMDSHRNQIAKPVNEKPGVTRRSYNRMIVRRVARSFHRRGNRVFIKKTQCRYTLRDLLTTRDFAVCSTKILRVLLKCLSVALRECVVLPNERKMLSRQHRLFKRELRNRNFFKKRPKEDEVSLLSTTGFEASAGTFNKIYTQKENCEFVCSGRNFGVGQKIEARTDSVGIDRRTWARSKKMNICSLKNEKKCEDNQPVFKRRSSNHGASESFQRTNTVDSNSCRFPEEAQNDRTNQSTKIRQDEIDDIFSSLGL